MNTKIVKTYILYFTWTDNIDIKACVMLISQRECVTRKN